LIYVIGKWKLNYHYHIIQNFFIYVLRARTKEIKLYNYNNKIKSSFIAI